MSNKILGTVIVNEVYQSDYSYELSEKQGKNFGEDFKPDLTPKQMLDLGIFGGNYFVEIPNEFPRTWFKKAKFSQNKADKNLNYFKVNASQALSVWEKNGWIYDEDPKGWFLWYCRYYQGRRIDEEDHRQIKRWKNMKRHITQLQNNCDIGDENCRPRQRQALLHWAYDSRNL
ncbi:MAG: hypothetical protein KBF89_07580 [Acidimicrobiia bacterium]|nr:hypothetical protein [Acidimicrobiia bacterium]